MSVKYELQVIISGNGQVSFGKTIQAITHHLRREKETIQGFAETKLFSKEQETKILIAYIDSMQLWFADVDFSKYIGEGAEQKIYESSDQRFVLKLNDSIFYAFWKDYLNSLLLHNYFFLHLAYELLGFCEVENQLYAVVKQAFVKSTEPTNLDHVNEFLFANGFVRKRNNDYVHPELGIILEDLHDENVLTEEGVLQFIDTIFFLMPEFYLLD